MKLSTLGMGFGAMGLGAIVQQSGLWDLGEALKPVEDLASGAANAGAAVVKAAGNGVVLQPWLIAFAVFVLGVRFCAPAIQQLIQGRNDRAAHREAMELRRLDHELDLEKMREGNKQERRP